MYSTKQLNIGANCVIILLAVFAILIWTYIIATAQPLTPEQKQDYLEAEKNDWCPYMPSEEHCRHEYNKQILLLDTTLTK